MPSRGSTRSASGGPASGDDVGFPFSAVVGQQRLQLALILCAVHPGIGGVLVRGEKGTAKSTVVRALARLLPPVVDETGARPARLVELPVGATEDRVVGSLDLERILRDGEQAFRPGLLAAAHHGVLYVDEVNLLHDHLVDVLLDAAAMGRVHIERDGVSHSHPARFVLVGTMNPEEGELRPQLLDRFGLTVDVAASREVEVRMAVVRGRLEYEADPAGFVARYADADAEIADRILTARDRLPGVTLNETELRRIAALCASFEVDGMRADLVVARTAVAHAAWCGRDTVTAEDVRIAAELALPHRRRRDPFDEPGISEEQLDEAMRSAAEQVEQAADTGDRSDSGADRDDDPDGGPDSPGGGETPRDADPPHTRDGDRTRNGDIRPPETGNRPSETDGDGRPDTAARETGAKLPADATRSRIRPPRWEVPGIGEGAPGRRSRARTRQGRVVRATPESTGGLHLLGTVFAAAPHQYARGRRGGPLRFAPGDLRGAYREGREGNLVVFVVDVSGSMAARDRLAAVTDAIVALLRDAYQRRDKVAVITVRGADAELVLPPTSSVDIAVRRLADIRTGGKTPLAAGLLKAREVVRAERVRDPHRRPMLVLLTDGRATGGSDALPRARTAAGLLARENLTSIVVDCERGMIRLGLAAELAHTLRGVTVRLAELTGDSVAEVVRAGAPGAARAA
ncbi:magnesium chelatase subunit D family protein [Nocardia brevicatena]|uniref:magnesium chelatase subunit D family protein n=1 Tax=Nocardia brevicatena TaxID=37327 RepID=UPI00068832DA|nr:magnesium chelatase subunit D family protein [Nocardia brevicatena]